MRDNYMVHKHDEARNLIAFPGPLIKLLECVSAALVPVWYMIFPPTMPEYEDMLKADGEGVRRPPTKVRKVSSAVSYRDALEVLIICWCFGWI